MSTSSNTSNLLRELPSDAVVKAQINDNDEEFPTSIRVLLVDAVSESFLLLKNLMTQFSYIVTSYENGEDAIDFLRKSKDVIDLVIWEFHNPKINGVQALETIGKEMDLPLAIMSSDHSKGTVAKSIRNGACDFLAKPLSKEVIKILWRHALPKLMSKKPGLDKPDASSTKEDDIDRYQSNEEEGSRTVGYSGDLNTSESKGGRKPKKRRMHWTPKLHKMFENAIAKLGDNAVPKQILNCMLEEMNVPGLTRNTVASHLQKYRLSSKKKTCVPQETDEEDLGLNNAETNVAHEASTPLLNVGIINNQFLTNIIAGTNPIMQCPSSSYQRVNNNPFMTINPRANNYPYIDQFHQPQQQDPPLRSPSDQLTYEPTLPFGPDFYTNSCFGLFK